MSRDHSLYENFNMLDQSFPIIFHSNSRIIRNEEECFSNHWHEKIEFLFITRGKGSFRCNSTEIIAGKGDLVIFNSNESHYGKSLSDHLQYYCIIVDTSFFYNRNFDLCQTKYIEPIEQNRILFENLVKNNEKIKQCIKTISQEFESLSPGYELAVKSQIYNLFVILLRNHAKVNLSEREYTKRIKTLESINKVLKFVESNYDQTISLEMLSKTANMSKYHFSRLFKIHTGRSPIDYVNYFRIQKAEALLKDSDSNISEVAYSCGFSDTNYFSRLYKKFKGFSPSKNQ